MEKRSLVRKDKIDSSVKAKQAGDMAGQKQSQQNRVKQVQKKNDMAEELGNEIGDRGYKRAILEIGETGRG